MRQFQGGRCTVRDTAGRYHHIDTAGRPVYPDRWRYAGDFRDGLAVVQRDDGLSSHIDEDGHLTEARLDAVLTALRKAVAHEHGDAWHACDAERSFIEGHLRRRMPAGRGTGSRWEPRLLL